MPSRPIYTFLSINSLVLRRTPRDFPNLIYINTGFITRGQDSKRNIGSAFCGSCCHKIPPTTHCFCSVDESGTIVSRVRAACGIPCMFPHSTFTATTLNSLGAPQIPPVVSTILCHRPDCISQTQNSPPINSRLFRGNPVSRTYVNTYDSYPLHKRRYIYPFHLTHTLVTILTSRTNPLEIISCSNFLVGLYFD